MRVIFEESVEYHNTKTVCKQKVTLDIVDKTNIEE